jgi:translation elongation factor EF-Tu-like GTPase
MAENDLSRLYSLGLVEQRGLSMGLTVMGMQTIARARRSEPIAMGEGVRFAIREGGRTVGVGVVTKIAK